MMYDCVKMQYCSLHFYCFFQNNNRGGFNVGDVLPNSDGNADNEQYKMVSISLEGNSLCLVLVRYF